MKLQIKFKGGPGSGHHGHSGRPGKVGGSAPEGGGDVPEDVLNWDAELKKTTDRARSYGIKSFNAEKARAYAREAAGVVNSNRGRKGWTVYSSDSIVHGSTDEYFPMIGYGAGESKKQVAGIIRLLRDFGYTAVIGPENYGVLVSHKTWE